MMYKLLRGWSLQRGRFTFKFMPSQWYFGVGLLREFFIPLTLSLTFGPFQLFVQGKR